jgi:hypothetical protein
MTARTAGFHSANRITPEPLPAQANLIEDNAYNGREETNPPGFNSNNIELYYCWTHGLSRNAQHTSAQCSNKADNHQTAATLDNRMGGVNKISFGRSGKARKVNTIKE